MLLWATSATNFVSRRASSSSSWPAKASASFCARSCRCAPPRNSASSDAEQLPDPSASTAENTSATSTAPIFRCSVLMQRSVNSSRSTSPDESVSASLTIFPMGSPRANTASTKCIRGLSALSAAMALAPPPAAGMVARNRVGAALRVGLLAACTREDSPSVQLSFREKEEGYQTKWA